MARTRKSPTRRRVLSVVLLVSVTAASCLALACHAPAAAAHNVVRGALGRHHSVTSKRRDPKARASVVGGEPVVAGTFPFMAFIVAELPDGLEGACSGTVVSSNLVLTAAHCVTADEGTVVLEPSAFAVVTGTVDWAMPPREISAVSAVLPDPSYEASGLLGGWHDDALLELASPISAPPVRLASTPFWTSGTPATIAGWGETENAQASPTTDLQWASTVVQSEAFCKEQAGSDFHPLAELCTIDAPTYRSATCLGDSGGPLLATQPGTSETVEIGVTNFGIEEGCPTTSPRFDTRADVISNWVANRIRELAPSSPTVPPPPTPVRPPSPSRTTATPATPATPTLPTMTSSEARSYVRQGLIVGLRSDFARHSDFRVKCQSVTGTEEKCSVSWSVGSTAYGGSVMSYLAFKGSVVVWNDSYRIHSVNFSCSPRRKNCPIRRTRVGRVLDSGT